METVSSEWRVASSNHSPYSLIRYSPSIHLHALLGEIFARAGMEGHGRLADALVLQLQLGSVAMDRLPLGLLLEHGLHHVIGELVRHFGIGDHDVPHAAHLVV